MRSKAFLAAMLVAVVFAGISSPSAHADAPNKPKSQNTQNTVAVQPGDTLTAIAEAHQTTYVRLFNANAQIADPDVINPGDSIRLPAVDEQLADRPIPSNVVAIPAAAPKRTYAPVVTATPVATTTYASDGSVWDRLAQCESGGNWGTSTGNGFYGGLQFTQSSWAAAGGSGSPSQASREEQIARAQVLQARQGWSAWPACSAKLGLR